MEDSEETKTSLRLFPDIDLRVDGYGFACWTEFRAQGSSPVVCQFCFVAKYDLGMIMWGAPCMANDNVLFFVVFFFTASRTLFANDNSPQNRQCRFVGFRKCKLSDSKMRLPPWSNRCTTNFDLLKG